MCTVAGANGLKWRLFVNGLIKNVPCSTVDNSLARVGRLIVIFSFSNRINIIRLHENAQIRYCVLNAMIVFTVFDYDSTFHNLGYY